MSISTRLIAGFLLATLSLSALAHPGPVAHDHGLGLWAGLTHPLTGLGFGLLAVVIAARLASGWLRNRVEARTSAAPCLISPAIRK